MTFLESTCDESNERVVPVFSSQFVCTIGRQNPHIFVIELDESHVEGTAAKIKDRTVFSFFAMAVGKAAAVGSLKL